MLTAMYMCVLGNNTNFETGSTYTGSTTMVDSYMEDLSKKKLGVGTCREVHGHLLGAIWYLIYSALVKAWIGIGVR